MAGGQRPQFDVPPLPARPQATSSSRSTGSSQRSRAGLARRAIAAALADRATAQSIRWVSEFGTAADDIAWGVTRRATGGLYVVGHTNGVLPGQQSAGGYDAYIRKLDASGAVVWTRQFGSSGNDFAFSVAEDVAGNVDVVGYTDGSFPGFTLLGSFDSFIRKYDASGNEVWTRQFGSDAVFGGCISDAAFGVADGANPDAITVLLRFEPGGRFPAHSHPAGEEVFVVEGEFKIGHQHFSAGDYLYAAPDEVHAVWSERGGAVLVMLPKPVEILAG